MSDPDMSMAMLIACSKNRNRALEEPPQCYWVTLKLCSHSCRLVF